MSWWKDSLIVGPFTDLAAANAWAAANPSSLFPGLLATAGGVQIRWGGTEVGWKSEGMLPAELAGSDTQALLTTKRVVGAYRGATPIGRGKILKINNSPTINPAIRVFSQTATYTENKITLTGYSSEKLLFIRDDSIKMFSGISAKIVAPSGASVCIKKIGLCQYAAPYLGHFFCIDYKLGKYWIEGNYGTAYTGTITTDATLVAKIEYIGFTIQRNTVTGWAKNAGDDYWTALCSYEIGAFLEARTPDFFKAYKWCVINNTTTGYTSEISNICMGIAGHTGLADFCAVTYLDGSPYSGNDGLQYVTASLRGPFGGFACGIFSIDRTGKIQRTGTILTSRDGLVQGDTPITIKKNMSTGEWLLFASGFGDAGYSGGVMSSRIYFGTSFGDILGYDNVIPVTRCTDVYAYDADVIFFNGTYYMVYMTNNFAANIKYSTSLNDLMAPDHPVSYTIPSNVVKPTAEGPKWYIIGGKLRLLIGSVVDGGAALMYSSSGEYIGQAFGVDMVSESDQQTWSDSISHPTILQFKSKAENHLIFAGFTSVKITPKIANNSGRFTYPVDSWQYGDLLLFEATIPNN